MERQASAKMSMSETVINWYPGHMAKTRRLLQEQLKKVDLVLELCDARLPFSSRNPELRKMTEGKQRILFLNKADLADPGITRAWIDYFRDHGESVYPVNSISNRSKEVLGIIEKHASGLIEKYRQKDVHKTVRCMVIGVPNVGKSTMVNNLRGSKIAKTGDRPGVTRNQQWIRIHPYLELMDTPGMLWPRLDDQSAAKKLCYIGSINDEAVDIYEICISLLAELKKTVPDAFISRFHPDQPDTEGTDLLDEVCRGRGWLLKGNRYDYDRCCRVVLDEFRGGKLGRISLERPGKGSDNNND